MKHLKYARDKMPIDKRSFNGLAGSEISFDIQNGPIGEAGVNGVQIADVIEFAKDVIVSLNKEFPCRENSLTITKLEEALHWQEARTKDRIARGVEGENKE